MISWMTKDDDRKAWKVGCKDCQNKTENSNTFPDHRPCSLHEIEYATGIVTVLDCHFLDGEKPELGKDLINNLIIDPESNISWLVDHIDAEAYEGRDTVLQLKLKKMTRDELNTLPEWEP